MEIQRWLSGSNTCKQMQPILKSIEEKEGTQVGRYFD